MRNVMKKPHGMHYALIAVILVAALFIMPLSGAGAAELDLNELCSLTLIAEERYASDLDGHVVFDIYKIADATAREDTPEDYKFTGWLSEGLEALYDSLADQVLAGADESGIWQQLSQAAANAIVKGEVTAEPVFSMEKFNEPRGGIPGGLYLILARAAEQEFDEPTDMWHYDTEDSDGNIVTWINTGGVHYTFSPIMLQAMPYREGTAGSWQHHFSLEVKIGSTEETGKLIITKTLNTKDIGADASFGFNVYGLDPANPGSSRYYTVTFTEAGTLNVVTITGIPYGTTLTVEEDTETMTAYEPVGETSYSVTISEETPEVEVNFVNEFSDSLVKEASVINRFTYVEGSGWSWVQVPGEENNDAYDSFRITMEETVTVVEGN